jgi:hypothetical protein
MNKPRRKYSSQLASCSGFVVTIQETSDSEKYGYRNCRRFPVIINAQMTTKNSRKLHYFLDVLALYIPEPPVDVPGVDEVHPDILETLRHLHILGAVDEGAAPHSK